MDKIVDRLNLRQLNWANLGKTKRHIDIDESTRKSILHKLYHTVEYDNTVYVIGFGCLGTLVTFILHKLLKTPHIIVVECDSVRNGIDIKSMVEKFGGSFICEKVTKENYEEIFRDAKKGDIVIDCAYDIDSAEIIKFLHSKSTSYINTSIEEWSYKNVTDIKQYTIYNRNKVISDECKKLTDWKSNCIVSMGCNPGCVNVWTQIGLDLIDNEFNFVDSVTETYSEVCKRLDVQTIHVSEIDTQKSTRPKLGDEYCNTWGSTIHPFYEEAIAPCELTYGTHETAFDDCSERIDVGDNTYAVFDRMACYTNAQSYSPIYGSFIGMMIRHDECHTIGQNLKCYDEDGNCEYSPSVYYVYHPSDLTMMSIHELKQKNLTYQTKYRLMAKEIMCGMDELGVLYFLGDGSIYWIGSYLNIHEARNLLPETKEEYHDLENYVNATNIQVMAGIIPTVLMLMNMANNNEHIGLISPETIPCDELFPIMRLFLGDFKFTEIKDYKPFAQSNKFSRQCDKKIEYDLKTFLTKM
jgi:homospermidine synthase